MCSQGGCDQHGTKRMGVCVCVKAFHQQSALVHTRKVAQNFRVRSFRLKDDTNHAHREKERVRNGNDLRMYMYICTDDQLSETPDRWCTRALPSGHGTHCVYFFLNVSHWPWPIYLLKNDVCELCCGGAIALKAHTRFNRSRKQKNKLFLICIAHI